MTAAHKSWRGSSDGRDSLDKAKEDRRTMSGAAPRKVTIAEVAKAAGVSTATAGRALGNYGYVSADIRRRVRESAERLGYRPNLLARGLITGKTRTIGVVAGDIQSPFYASILRGISDEARSEGFGVILTNSDEILDRELDAVRLLREKQVDGLIVAPCDTERSEHLRRAFREGLPIVQFDRAVEDLPAASVMVNNREISRHATTSLIASGHRRIAIIAELERWTKGDLPAFIDGVRRKAINPDVLFPSWQRLFGFIEAHIAAGLEIDLSLIGRVGTYSFAATRNRTRSLLADPNRPTALFTADGLMTAAAIDTITEMNIAVPEQLSLIGFDDLDWMAFIKPGITAIAQPVMEMGKAAARLMLEGLASNAQPRERLVLQATLVWRGSVMPPAPQAPL